MPKGTISPIRIKICADLAPEICRVGLRAGCFNRYSTALFMLSRCKLIGVARSDFNLIDVKNIECNF